MKEELKVGGCAILFSVLLIIALSVGSFYLNKVGCFSKASDMGFNVNYSYFGGCKIEVEENKWIPLDSYYFKQE